jgi:hypothetical protein
VRRGQRDGYLPSSYLTGSTIHLRPVGFKTVFFCPNFWDSSNLEGQVPIFISHRNRVAQIYPRALGSLFVASYDSQGCGGGILTRLHTGMFTWLGNFLYDTGPNGEHFVRNEVLKKKSRYRTAFVSPFVCVWEGKQREMEGLLTKWNQYIAGTILKAWWLWWVNPSVKATTGAASIARWTLMSSGKYPALTVCPSCKLLLLGTWAT